LDKDGDPKMFHPRDSFDLMKMCLGWFENEAEPEKMSLSEIKKFFGYPEGIEHRAMGDVEPTADILCRLIQFQRNVMKKNKPRFKGAFSREV
jgi:DNA polymerase III epsilon subunit-like protein